MLSKLQELLYRHQRKLVVGGILIGGGILLRDYFNKVIKEFSQETETRDLLERNMKQQHYDSVDTLCTQTALRMSTNLNNSILKELNTEELVDRLRSGTADKITVWEELKILSFTKIFVVIYANAMLMICLRLQLNLIGGYNFRDGIDRERKVSMNIQEKYMNLCQFFIEEGVKKLCGIIRDSVTTILKDVSLKKDFKISDIEAALWSVDASIHNDPRDPRKTLPEYFLPDKYRNESFSTDSKIFDQIINETHDLFECKDVQLLVTSSVNSGFKFVVMSLNDYYRNPNVNNVKNSKPRNSSSVVANETKSGADAFEDISAVSKPLAKIIPILNGLIHSRRGGDTFCKEWMKELVKSDDLKTLGANIYETFSSKW